MPDLGLEFQPHRPGLLPLLLLFAAGVLCVDAGIDLRDQHAQLAELQAQQAAAQRRAERLALATSASAGRAAALPSDQEKALRQAVAAIRVDWEELYRHIDRATPEDVALLALTPNVAGASLQISGEARDIKAALGFVEALRRPPLSKVSLLSHKVKAEDPQHPVTFEIAATWSSPI
ncbi:PilN domain-containing protein [Dechloromonas sp. A34]|uniref:PilN domain-containing protein n=1 Tax=Dechloromonas sp. A34 TaxID=447588 RepID=UPI0022491636|nr:PilN domain-containing protein [Dechloromonas sp. A34]